MMNNDGVNVLPPGFRFRPTDYEILMDYLLNKVKGLPLPCAYAITDCDLYDGKDRWKEMFDGMPFETSLYFFVKLSKKTEKGLRINRFAGTGTWKETQNEKPVYSDCTNLHRIGTKKSFKFGLGKKSSSDNLSFRWLMDEYHLNSCFLDNTMTEYVVCHIKREKEIKPRSRKAANKSPNSNVVTSNVASPISVLETWNVVSPISAMTSNVASPILAETSIVESQVSAMTSNVTSPISAETSNVVSPVAVETLNVVPPIAVNASASWTNEDLKTYYLWSADQPMTTKEEIGGGSSGWITDSNNNATFNSSSGIYLEDVEVAGNNNQAMVEYNAADGSNSNLWITQEEFEALLTEAIC